MNLNEDYWDNRYINNDIGWDLGQVSPPLKAYFDQLTDKTINILIPGGGNSYEAEYLFNNGFKNVHVVDLSTTALDNIKARCPEFPKNQLIHANFFDLKMTFDLIIEQTFFCAINPSLRPSYAAQMSKLLAANGILAGLLFNVPLNDDKPPFGGHQTEYETYFKPYFDILLMEPSKNSESSRADKELFFKLKKK